MTGTILKDSDDRRISVSSDNPEVGGLETDEYQLVENLLSSKRVIDALVKMVLDDKLRPPFTVGVYGDWGTGKTYFLKSMKETIDKRAVSDPKPLTVIFEAWRHQADEDILVTMLQCAYEALPKKVKNNQVVKRGLRSGLMAAASNLPEARLGLGSGSDSIELALSLSPGEIAEKFKQFNDAYKQEKFEEKQRQVKLHDRFREVIDKLVSYDDNGKRIGNGQPKRRIVFFIDDLDRCLPEKVVDLLEKIKLFLWHPNCVFVIGADQNQVKDAVGIHRGYGDNVALRYLEKIINFPFHMPPIDAGSYREFISDKLPDSDCKEELADIFAAACDERQASLRLMIQLCNSFILNDYLVSEGVRKSGKKYKPKIMAVLTALQVLYHDVFSRICGSWGSREDNLKAFFRAGQPGADGLSRIFGGENPQAMTESLQAMEKLKGVAEQAGYVEDKDDLLSYVEFLIPQSSVAKPDRSGPEIWYEKDDMRWFAKDLPDLPRKQAEESLKSTVVGIKSRSLAVGSVLEIDGYHWRLLHNDSNKKALLITEYIIGRSYLDKPNSWAGYKYDWEKCMLNQELNSGEWLEEHLPLLSQKDLLIETKAGQETLDKVFLLSEEEAKSHFKADSDRTAVLLGTKTDNWWWLRSPGNIASYAASVGIGGSVNADGYGVSYGNRGVRPALWLNLTSEIFES